MMTTSSRLIQQTPTCLDRLSKFYKLLWGTIAVLLVTIAWSVFPGMVWAQPVINLPQAPDTCRVGVYVTGLRGFDFNNQSFTVDFEVWSI
ncbi:MAG: hypothetical protein ACO3NK_20500, partial [Prochlorotrichaceae cyanobacterium]